MCGINGFNWSDRSLVQKMNEALKHRGPDGDGVYLDGVVSLGSCRLAIIDLSEKGAQPMSNENGSIWLVYNGEIYNFQELRKELEQKGHIFKSDTDTEIIIHAYEEWQFKCLDRFNGMFAFAIYDSVRKILFLARDRFGIKPLYYYADSGKFIFSSEIKGILCHPVKRNPNDKIIIDYLSLSLLQHTNETFFNGINQLSPGHYLIYRCEDHDLSVQQWYRLQVNTGRVNKEETVEKIRDLFTDSVRLRMIADVPVGSCLSGGLDSSSIVCAMRQLSSQGDIRTFSSVFPGQKIDESGYIKEVADAANLKSLLVSPDEIGLLDDLDDLIRTQEEPFAGPSVYAQYRVMKLAHQNGMKVLLDGQGGDEVFGGYTYYFGFYFYELFRKLDFYRLLREGIFYLKYFRNTLPIQMLGFLLLPEWVKSRSWKSRVKWVDNELYREVFDKKVTDPRWLAKSLKDGQTATISHSSIPHLLNWEDKNSMRWSIETRIPFLDYRLVEKALALPPEEKLRDGVTKYIFRKAVAGTVPEKIINRRDKIGFEVSEDKWLKSKKMVEFIQNLIESKSFRERKYWDYQIVKKQFQAYIRNTRYQSQMARDIWKWVNLELWLRQFIDGEYQPGLQKETSSSKSQIAPGWKQLRTEAELWDLFTKKEEYSPEKLDKHDDFSYALRYQREVLEPHVSKFLIDNGFRARYPENKTFAVCLTHDVDNLYPPLTHILASSLYSVKNLNFARLSEQVLWKFSKRWPSPYNNFKQIIEMEKRFGAKSTFYFLATEKDPLRFRYRIEDLSSELKFIVDNGWEVGLHVGYYSYDSLQDITNEKKKLEDLTRKEIIGSRNHYLRFRTPDTWEMLAKAGFKYDTTFGYNDSIGFRNGMCHPFRPFNLDTDNEINIVEIPLHIMDGALLGNMTLNFSRALTRAKKMIDLVESNNGVITLLWHSHVFNCPFRENWAKLYESILAYCREKNAWMTSAGEIYKWWEAEERKTLVASRR